LKKTFGELKNFAEICIIEQQQNNLYKSTIKQIIKNAKGDIKKLQASKNQYVNYY
jgi:hypothetical protein